MSKSPHPLDVRISRVRFFSFIVYFFMKSKQSMGFFDKLKNFGSKIISGIRRGWDFARDRIVPAVRRVWNFAKPIADRFIPGSKPITDAIESGAGTIARGIGLA